MEDAALIVSALSLLVAGGSLAWNGLRWRAERRTDVHVLAWHDGMGMDIYSAEVVEVEHVIALRVVNRGERPEHVMWTGLESPAGESLTDDRPKAPKIVDELPPEAQELPPRGQIAAQFKLPADVIADGFLGYAILGTGKRIYAVPATPEPDLGEIHSDLREIIAREGPRDEDPKPPPS